MRNELFKLELKITFRNNLSVRPYDQFINELPDLVQSASMVLIPSQFVYTGGSSYAVYNAVRSFQKFCFREYFNQFLILDTKRKEIVENIPRVDDESEKEHYRSRGYDECPPKRRCCIVRRYILDG